MQIDQRYIQLVSLLALLTIGYYSFEIGFTLNHLIASYFSAIFTQVIFEIIFFKKKISQVNYKSAVITGTSLTLLLRTNLVYFSLLAGFLAIASKFIFKSKDKFGNYDHIFNPANFACAVLILLPTILGNEKIVWISSGQWGTDAIISILVIMMGLLVTVKSYRYDVTLAFIIFTSCFFLMRALHLNDPLTIPLHQLFNGSILIFSFFMISDPRSTPRNKLGRIIFALLVAIGFYLGKFVYFDSNSLILSLFFVSFLTPVINYFFQGKVFSWGKVRLSEQRI